MEVCFWLSVLRVLDTALMTGDALIFAADNTGQVASPSLHLPGVSLRCAPSRYYSPRAEILRTVLDRQMMKKKPTLGARDGIAPSISCLLDPTDWPADSTDADDPNELSSCRWRSRVGPLKRAIIFYHSRPPTARSG